MTRVWFHRPPAGCHAVRGELVHQVQQALQAAGHHPGALDGVFGSQTEAALRAYQTEQRWLPTGAVDAKTWLHLVGPEPPGLQARWWEADFEGHSFTKVAGNVDGAGLTYGIIGFTLASGSLQRVLTEVRDRSLHHLTAAVGPFTPKLLQVLDAPRAEQLRWAQGLSQGRGGIEVHPVWAAAFRLLGRQAEVQTIQLAHVQPYWERALADATRCHLSTELGLALCFDIAVQHGGINSRDQPRIQERIEASTSTTEQDHRVIIAGVVAEHSQSAWRDTVQRRQLTLATGRGEVKQAAYDLASWGLAEVLAAGGVPCA